MSVCSNAPTEHGQVPLENLIMIEKAHDVRRLCTCDNCGEWGDHTKMITKYGLSHGRCYARVYGVESLLSLPNEETGKLTIGDLGTNLTRKLIASRGLS